MARAGAAVPTEAGSRWSCSTSARGRGRRDPQLRLQDLLQLAISLQGSRDAALGGVEPHLGAIGLFAIRIGLHGPARSSDGTFQVPGLLPCRCQLLQGIHAPLTAAGPLQERPLLEAAGQQLPPIAAECALQEEGAVGRSVGARGGVEEDVELGDVCDDGLGIELHAPAIGHQEAAGGDARRLQRAAHGGETGAEAGAARLQLHLRPEEVDELIPGMALAQMEGQVGEERGRLVGAEPG
jgi:hypothetical protein